jgi:pimeloyl-ACP methyl ester carboxylesterase
MWWMEQIFWTVTVAALCFCLWQLEAERASVHESEVVTQAGPVTLYSADSARAGPLVVVTHGFAGSRQMMQYISRDLARAGFLVAAFDFHGQGRSVERMSADVTRIEGTTRQLVEQTLAVTEALLARGGSDKQVGLLGHSMATDIVIRAAANLPEVPGIVAISMYSDAITPEFPQRLLVLSGEWEGRLRAVGMQALAQVDPAAREGVTAQNGDVLRRAVSVPGKEHVAVLFSGVTMDESRRWFQAAFERPQEGVSQPQGVYIVLVFCALVVLIWPVSKLLPHRRAAANPLSGMSFFLTLLLPGISATLAATVFGGGLFGSAAFGSLLLFFGIWGVTALVLLHRAGRRLSMPSLIGVLFLVAWALGGFALALDRYGAAFLPTGPRLPLMAALTVGTIPFAVADRHLVTGTALWQRLVARVVPLVFLALAMMLTPQNMGLSFTVLPVMVLFYAVYGTMGRAVALRSGPHTAGLALGIVLAWSIAASTPLFVG